ncbi:TIM-barrel domain-containing protein [Hymenobacter sp.]|uniref:TIM-barrel domain-containing protein n=1 Tax=Hymenobacter sp. TaxID=1898978 RepID=UPI00286A621E|nr:TIM-barrel domain-containing protein [Hymenobacter sp.]
MKANFFTPGALLLLAVLPLLRTPAAQAQRADQGRPANDPFGRRPARAVPGGRYLSHAYAKGILTVAATDGSSLRMRPWAPGVVKVEYFAPGRAARPDSSVSVVQAPNPWAPPFYHPEGPEAGAPRASFSAWRAGDVRATRAALEWPVDGTIRVIVQKNPLRVRCVRRGETLVAEAGGSFRRSGIANGEPGGTGVSFRLAPGERLYGTGSRALPVDRRGHRLELYNQAHYASQNGEPNLNITLPTVLSSRGYLLFFDHHAAGYLDLGKTDPNVLEYGGENLTSLSYFVITGRNQTEILDRYTALTGRQPLPPRWALGLIQSRFGYKSDAEMQQVAARMRRENFPLDALVLDLYWFGGTTRQGDLSWDQPKFPDPVGMMSRLRQQGVKTILISEPYVMRTSRNDSTVRTRGLVGTTAAGRPFTVASFWAGPASILDVFKPAARDWLWGYYRTLRNQGAAGWWSDLGEPENHPEAMRHVAGPTRAVHNAYGQSWASILTEGYAREFPEERVFNLARSGWAGLQRNSVFPWSGDINRSWSGYQAQVPVMLGMSAGGVGYMHSDAGGFCVGGIDPELYTRWLQMASLCPILRPHGEGVPPEPYYYPNPYKSSVRAAMQLRYQLLPYLYTLAWQNTTTGAPLVRPMDYDAALDNAALNEESRMRNEELSSANSSFFIPHSSLSAASNDQYLLGPNLLVAPVLHPSQRRRNVVLPAGNWVDFATNQTYAGGRTTGVVAPLAHAPLLVRAGAFLPMTAYRPSTAQYRPDTLLLRYYPDPQTPKSSFTLYEDDGHSAQALAKKQFELLKLSGSYAAGQTDILLATNGGQYPGQPARRWVELLIQRVAAAPDAVLLNQTALPPGAVAYDPARRELRLGFFLLNPGTVVSLRGLRLTTAPATNSDPETLTLEAPGSRSFGPGGTALHYTRHPAGRADAPVLLLIRNAQGGVVRVLELDGRPGPHALAWDGRDENHRPVPPGVYVAEAGEQHQRLIVTQ